MERDIQKIKNFVWQAKAKGHSRVCINFFHDKYADNPNAQKMLEKEIQHLGYDFEWLEMYDNNGVSWATNLIFTLRCDNKITVEDMLVFCQSLKAEGKGDYTFNMDGYFDIDFDVEDDRKSVRMW